MELNSLTTRPKTSSKAEKIAAVSVADRELSEALMELIPRSMIAIRSQLRANRQSNFSVPQFRVLIHLRGAEHTNRVLAEHLGVSVPAMSRLVTGLIDRGLIEREMDLQDRREFKLHLTSAGRRLVEETRRRSIQELAKKITRLNESERKTLHLACDLLTQIFGT